MDVQDEVEGSGDYYRRMSKVGKSLMSVVDKTKGDGYSAASCLWRAASQLADLTRDTNPGLYVEADKDVPDILGMFKYAHRDPTVSMPCFIGWHCYAKQPARIDSDVISVGGVDVRTYGLRVDVRATLLAGPR